MTILDGHQKLTPVVSAESLLYVTFLFLQDWTGSKAQSS